MNYRTTPITTVKHYSGTVELTQVFPLDLNKFLAIGGVKSKHNSYDSFSRKVGMPKDGPAAVLPVTRTIFFKRNPSLHKCDARCQSAKGHDCECQCGGKNHGEAA
jgi:hypothetical protein